MKDLSHNLLHQNDNEPVDALDRRILKSGGYSTSLKWGDLQKLRAVVKKVHLKHYPNEMVTDREADRIIDALAPGTAEYLLRRHYYGES